MEYTGEKEQSNLLWKLKKKTFNGNLCFGETEDRHWEKL